jgi:hypothetical protein
LRCHWTTVAGFTNTIALRSYGAGGEGVASLSPSKLMEMPMTTRANDMSRSLAAFDQHSTLTVVVDDAAS